MDLLSNLEELGGGQPIGFGLNRSVEGAWWRALHDRRVWTNPVVGANLDVIGNRGVDPEERVFTNLTETRDNDL